MNSNFEPKTHEDTEKTLSRTKLKKASLDITDFAKKLLELSEDRLKKLPLEEHIIYELLKAKPMKKIALKRQTQYIGKLMRNSDIDQAVEYYDKLMQKNKASNVEFKRLEQLRDALIHPESMKEALDRLVEKYPAVDIQKLRQLIRAYHKEVQKSPDEESSATPKSYKLIFQFLKSLSQG
ncbi:ribosome biogenesis factor YjgA [Fangia hongkongensis]|uniref:ribosome biogenesis factor YjgA n=2 Tax=Fangia hongkongensis TaxID=270495 RepID=UPI00038259E4|nr:ribosome biogenesis factor YjgA [Fangia hongkongensis]